MTNRNDIGDDVGSVVKFVQGVESETLDRFGPVGATILATAPVAVLEAIPGGLALKKARKLKTTIADEIIEKSNDRVKASAIDDIKALY